MTVGQLQVPLSAADLEPEEAHSPGPHAPALPGGSGRSAQELHRMIMQLPDGAGDGLAAIFRKALPIICSGSAFLDDNGESGKATLEGGMLLLWGPTALLD